MALAQILPGPMSTEVTKTTQLYPDGTYKLEMSQDHD